jgi:uncharacterized membrane protein
MGFMMIVPLLVVVLIVWFVLEESRRRGDRVYPPAPNPYAASPDSWRSDARERLDERYARGEMDRQDYLQRREDLAR